MSGDGTKVCPCGYKARSDNVRRHMRSCKKLKVMPPNGASVESLQAALILKEDELQIAKARIATLEAQSTTTNVNNVSININPLMMSGCPLLLEQPTLPERTMVRKRIGKLTAPEAVPGYLKIKHFLTGPEFSNIRIKDSTTGLEVVEQGRDGKCRWVPMPTAPTLTTIVARAFCEFEDQYDPYTIAGLDWQNWLESEGIYIPNPSDEDVIDFDEDTDAFQKMVTSAKEVFHKGYVALNLPREAVCDEM